MFPFRVIVNLSYYYSRIKSGSVSSIYARGRNDVTLYWVVAPETDTCLRKSTQGIANFTFFDPKRSNMELMALPNTKLLL